jgi:arabinose-5-phosphate isomerase
MKAQAKKIHETATSDLTAGRRVLELEAAGLGALGRALDGGFVAAVERLLGIDGRVVVSGMGKSGHVARKIAATLASTGTPALYVHPGEASHGDLGMITRHDAVLALSNSGNTPELSDIVAYSRRFGICLIGMTSVAGSPIAEQADVALILPKTPEACPMGLAPTTSTTMMMALGDALAIALLERRGFSPQDFQVFHPGGTLGSRLLRVSDVMQRPATLPLCGAAVIAMTRSSGELRSFGCVGIVDEDGLLIGIISDGDLRRHMQPDLLERRAGEVMTKAPKTIRPQALVAEALGFMNELKITSLFVVDDGRPVGFLHMHDCLQAGVT